MKKRLFAVFASLCMVVSMLPTMAFAQDSGAAIGASGLCEHHTEHTADCGYTEGTAEIPCSHEHTEDCYTLVTKCVHEHTAECYPAESVSENTATPSDAEGKEPVCGHVCSEESGCITKTLDCKHTHDETCGYVPATAGTPCTFVCEVCNAQDSGNPATPSDAQTEKCTCETLCTEEEINTDCPVCSAEGAELDKVCVGAAPMLPVTALADGVNAPDFLYVGGTLVSSNSDGGYWTTDAQGELTASTANGDWNVKYEPSSATLTLKGATIKGGSSTDNSSGAGIYAKGKANSDVALTIVLEGDSTISGNYGIFILTDQESGGAASLTIKGNYELSVTGTNTYGIVVNGQKGNTSLTIENATVTASTSGASAAGVGVQSYSTDSTLSIAVNSGSLTASGNENSSSGIEFVNNSSSATLGTNLTVGNSAVVKANNGIKCTNASKPTPTGTGIVFDGTEGTVYGNVTLDKSLTINQGETLTIPTGSSLDCNNNLTNNGTIVNTGGTLSGTPSGSGTVVNAPTIGTQPADKSVTEGETATFTVAAKGENLSYQWQQSTDTGQSWTEISGATGSTYTTDAATLAMNNYQYRCVVSNSAGSVTSSAATLTVNTATVSVTGVTLNPTTLSLYTGESETLTATVTPDNATNKAVTWSSDKHDVATVEGGTVTAVGAGEATITVKTEDGNHTASCKVTVTQSAYSISADTTALDFDSACPGYTQPAAQTVTITNDGNQPLTLTQPASTSSFEVGTLTDTELAAGEKATFTVQPKAGMAVGTYSEDITVSSSQSATVTISASFTVKQRSGGGGGGGSSYRDGEYDFWTDVGEKIADADPGDTIKVNARSYDRMPWSVMEALREAEDVTLHITWNGGEDIIIPSAAALDKDNGRIYYPLSYLEGLDFSEPAKQTGAGQTGGSTVEVEAPASDPAGWEPTALTEGQTEEQPESEPEESASQPESEPALDPETEPETKPEIQPEEEIMAQPESGGLPLALILGGGAAVIAAGLGFWFWKRRTQE